MALLRKAQQEVAEFHRFQQLCRDWVTVSEKIYQLCPLEETLTPGGKTAEAIRQEILQQVDRLLAIVLRGRRRAGRLDLEAVEMVLRSGMHRAAAAGF